MKLAIIIISCVVVSTRCATFREYAPITAFELVQGFSCKSYTKELGRMKNNEVKSNYIPNFCGVAVCRNGVIDYETCGIKISKECALTADFSKPYPECCRTLKFVEMVDIEWWMEISKPTPEAINQNVSRLKLKIKDDA
ncbi:Single domain von Willebrand factor type C [Popillia japonica]|uniref:Single domain von Willebrand factor type C n=1 Tax=Popillia japonica TaxID=7064 RepID=A0AAW1MXS8_POPJA